ncbi:MAG: hypothetical protein ACUVUU_01375 [bacterium]
MASKLEATSSEKKGLRQVQERHPCELCRCCSCASTCMRCKFNCNPSNGDFIPVIGCPFFEDMRLTPIVRYLYRYDYSDSFKLHLPSFR